MAQQLPERSNRMISIKHEDEGPYTCVNCCGIEDVRDIPNKPALWKHLEDYHDWPADSKESLHVKETK